MTTPFRLAAALLALGCAAAQAAPSTTLGGFYRKPQSHQERVADFPPSSGPSGSWTNGSEYIKYYYYPETLPASITTSRFAASRNHGSFTSGVLASEQLPLSTSPGYADATGRSLLYDDVVSFEGLSDYTVLTVGYRFWSDVEVPADGNPSAFLVNSSLRLGLSALAPGHSGAVGTPQFKVSYTYQWDEGGFKGAAYTAPTIRLNGQDISTSSGNTFLYEGTVQVGLRPGWTLGISDTGATSDALFKGTQVGAPQAGVMVSNQLDFWIAGFSDPNVRVAGALSGADYTQLPAVPEPGSTALLAAGLAGLGLWRRRRRG
ncbi:PEP-CTERM sorting domain-containing protein [Rubrivivax albus]|nr:PEP-CTERM sorting domain-containing protein [Rubrivivax albus]